MEDKIVVVDENDDFVREEFKSKCHEGAGILHRAFSVFIFNQNNELLLQQRSSLKPLWPGYWSNSCCSHPRKHESYEDAAVRRVQEELGIECKVNYLFKFQYQAKYKDVGSENEVCAVLSARCGNDVEIKHDPQEVAEFKYIQPQALLDDIKQDPDKYTPWFKLEIDRVLEHIGSLD